MRLPEAFHLILERLVPPKAMHRAITDQRGETCKRAALVLGREMWWEPDRNLGGRSSRLGKSYQRFGY